MPLLAFLARAFLLRRLLGGGRRSRRGSAYAPARRARARGGFGLRGPFPTYSRRTRGGGRVHVTGCCLPIPLALTAGAAAGTRLVRRRR